MFEPACCRGYIPLYAGVLITAVDSFLLLLIERLGIRNLEALFGVLIAVMALSFGFMAELAQVSLPSIAKGKGTQQPAAPRLAHLQPLISSSSNVSRRTRCQPSSASTSGRACKL